ncbi:murein hydrolase activator EnvC family protein [Arthrobacter sp. Ld5]|uniref:murein hydrolase activator EnvC family protein n=1 Tax=Arthrobacter sp. Ld5 TaxID=649152 RepID=UPI003EBCA945
MVRSPDRPAPPSGRPRPRTGVPGRAARAAGAAVLAVLLCLQPGSSYPAPAAAATPGRVAAAPFVPEWSWPLTPAPEVLRPFEKPPQKWERGHRGVDLSAGAGPVRVLSPADGVVSFAGTVVDRGVLSIDHGDGRISSFEPVSTGLSRGDRVGRGQEVAVLDASRDRRRVDGPARAHCGRPCLHWGVREDGEYVDPLSLVTDRRPSVLLPLDDWRTGGT